MSLRSKLGLSLAGIALGATLACGPKPRVESTPQERGAIFLHDFDNYQHRGRPREIKLFNAPRGTGILTRYEVRNEFTGDMVGSTEILFRPAGTDSIIVYFDANRSGGIPDFIGDYVLHSSSSTPSGGRIYHWNGINDMNTGIHRLCNPFNCDLTYEQKQEFKGTMDQESAFFSYLLAEAQTQ